MTKTRKTPAPTAQTASDPEPARRGRPRKAVVEAPDTEATDAFIDAATPDSVPEPDTAQATDALEPAAEAATPAAEPEGETPAPRVTKTDGVIAMLRAPGGASVDEIMAATGWQRHSVRGALAGAVKKKLGAAVTSEVVDDVCRYRAPEAAA